jgi:pimeloyl-ACP methyl ester carboxylesterase
MLISLLLLVFGSMPSFALLGDSSAFVPEKIALPAENVVLKGVHYLQPNGKSFRGQKVLLLHGLTSNFHGFQRYRELLVAHGYNVYAFNFRGHGNGTERSLVSRYQTGEYSFEQMAKIDFPAMLDYVSDGEPVIVIGHSMGGMVPRASLALGFADKNKISRMVLVGSPSTFDHHSLAPLSLIEMPLWIGSGAGSIPGGGMLTYGAQILSVIRNPLIELLTQGVVRVENFSTADGWLEAASSDLIPKDILRSFSRFRTGGFPQAEAELPVPALHILGSDDQLAPWREVINKAQIQSKDAGAWFVLLDRVSHLDLVAEKPLAAYKDILLSFLESPRGLGHKNGFTRRDLKCASYLTN